MRLPIALWRLLCLLLHLLHGLLIIWLRFGRLDARGRQREVRWWSGALLRRLGIDLQTDGLAKPGAKLLLANHVSWLDIAAIHAVIPEARFVSKSDVKHWPVVGFLTSAVGTLFIERASKRDALRVVHQCAEALEAGDTVAVFPEGTTGLGPEPLPFHGNLLQAAISTEAPVQPVALRWHEPAQRFSSAAQYVGDTSLLQSLWRIVCARGLGVRVQVLPPMVTAHADRRALAEHVRETLRERLHRD